jgi:predicted transcriptional regulator
MNAIPEFSELVNDLIGLGWTQQRIADEIEATQPTISRLLHQKRLDPPASVALPLIELHKREITKAKRRMRRRVA